MSVQCIIPKIKAVGDCILFKLQNITRKHILSFLGVNFGCFLFAFGVVVFRNPNDFATGGMSGLSLLINTFFPRMHMGAIMMLLNGLVLLLGYVVLGKKSATSSAYGTFALAGMIWLLEILIPLDAPLTDQKFMELIYSVFIPGFGMALVFHFGATTGGTDIVAQVVSKFTKWKIATSLLVVDFAIALGAGLIFGVEAMLYSVLGVCIRTFLMDSVMESLKIHKIVVVVSDKSQIIQDFITNELKRGATIHQAHGVYTRKEKDVITTVLTRRQALKLQQFIKDKDPQAFITFSNCTEIIGLGFGKFE